ncbi:MAG: hypothetical protein HY864_00815 [Chloroflexi bacterium]|nr:hypothetical protein [Chloroflexota bacterium]
MDLRDVMLEAQAEVQAVMREVVADLMEPQILAQLRQMWAGLPDELKEQFMTAKPDEYEGLMNMLENGGK